MLFALTHAAALLALSALMYATGYLVHSALPRLELPALGVGLTRVTLGTITWLGVLFVFACVGCYRAPIVLPIASLAVIAALVRSVSLCEAGPRAWLRERLPAPPSFADVGKTLLVSALPGVILLAIYVHTLSLRIGWDDNAYHLTLPKLYLAAGGFRPVPFNVYSNWPHATELLFGFALMLQDHVLAKLVHTWFLLLVVLAVFRICRQHGTWCSAVAACLFVLGNDVLLFEAQRANVDIAFAFFLLVALVCADEYLRSKQGLALLMTGVCCGVLAGIKLSGVAGSICVFAVVLSLGEWPRVAAKRAVVLTGVVALPTLVLAAPWYLKSYLYTGNPVYPFLYEWFGGREWNAMLGRQLFAWQHSIGMGRSLHDYLALPARVVLDGGRGYSHFDGQVGRFWLVVVPLSIVVALRATVYRVYLLSATVYFVLWAISSQQSRFLIAVLPLLAISGALAVEWIIAQLPAGRLRGALHVLFLAACCAGLVSTLYPSCKVAVREARELFERGPADPASVVPDAYTFIHTHTAKNAKIMLLNTNQGFFLEREYIADSFFEASQLNAVLSQAHSAQQLAAIVHGLGVTHIYLWRDDWGIRYPSVLWRFLRDEHWARRIYKCPKVDCSVYELRAP